MIAAGIGHQDPPEAYGVDLFTGERSEGRDQEMALAFVRIASEIRRMGEVAFFSRFGETGRIVPFIPEQSDIAAGRIFDLHQRHAEAVCEAFDAAVKSHAADLREQTLPPTCLLRLRIGSGGSIEPEPKPQPLHGSVLPVVGDIRFAIDEEKQQVVFTRWGTIGGALAALIIVLAAKFEEALADKLAPSNYPYTPSGELAGRLSCGSMEALRRRMQRVRKKVALLAAAAGDRPPALDEIVETVQGRGYRLNPDRIRIVKIAEVDPPAPYQIAIRQIRGRMLE